jgi:hypothetical protein
MLLLLDYREADNPRPKGQNNSETMKQWWVSAPMPPSGDDIKNYFTDLIMGMTEEEDDEGDNVILVPDTVEQASEDLLWFCDIIANSCFSKNKRWVPASSKPQKKCFSQAVGISDIAFAIMILEKHQEKWKKEKPDKSDRVKGNSLEESINYYLDVHREFKALFKGTNTERGNNGGMTTEQRVAYMDDWLVQKAKEKFEKEYQLKHGDSTRAGEGREEKEKSKKKRKTTTDYVSNHGIEDNPYLAAYIDYEETPV